MYITGNFRLLQKAVVSGRWSVVGTVNSGKRVVEVEMRSGKENTQTNPVV
jgi:hypothetical protein